jgi:hypothetical protein
MKNAGMSEKDVQRVLDALSKKDSKQLEKLAQEMADRMKDRGVSKDQIKQMMDRAAQRQQACKQMQQMASKMGQASKQMQQGNQKAAQDELNQAAEQLSEMEQMEQSLNDLEGQMASLDEARENLNNKDQDENGQCKQCNGTGFKKDGSPCKHCQGTGQGQCGKPGSGARKRDDNAQVDFVDRKAHVKQTKGGSIVGQQFVKGDQIKGKSEVEFLDAASAAEIDATDSLNRDRIPRAYRKGVKNYFDRLGETVKSEKQNPSAGAGGQKASDKAGGK